MNSTPPNPVHRGLPAMPGATSVSSLTVYSEVAPDGIAGGSPHLHLVSTEAYVVTAGAGELHSISTAGWRTTPLAPGVTVWFEPGVIHRAVNHGGLEVKVVMSHAGLPEAGDAVMTFPDTALADPDAYAAAAALPGAEATAAQRRAAALRRRDLAVEGYRSLLSVDSDGIPHVDAQAHERLLTRAAALVRPRVRAWRDIADATVDQLARDTAGRLAALESGAIGDLAHARLATASAVPAFGMCGTLIKDRPGGQP